MGYLNLEWLFFLPLTLPLPCCWVALVALILGLFLLPWKKLSSWQAKSLSLVGRLGLVKHVLSSMPLHIAMVLPLPKSVCYSIESCFRNFLWSVEFSKSRANYFSWDKVCLPISEGGLGIRRAHEFTLPASSSLVGMLSPPPRCGPRGFGTYTLKRVFSDHSFPTVWVLAFGRISRLLLLSSSKD